MKGKKMKMNNTKMPQNLKDLESQHLGSDTAWLLAQQDIITSSLMVEDVEPLEKLPEEVFEEYFLDYFRNSARNPYQDPTLLKKWLELAGGYYNEVLLVNQEGETVAVVPSLAPKTTLNLDAMRESHIGLQGNVFQQENKMMPAVAMNNLRNQFNTEGRSVMPNAEGIEDAQTKWVAIFKYFDDKKAKREQEQKESIDQVGSTISTQPTQDTVYVNPNTLLDDDLGISYDD